MQFKPAIIESEDQLIGLLRARRQAMGITHMALDQMVGWDEGYAAKVEAPRRRFGRALAWFFSPGLVWLAEALGCRIVLLDEATAKAVVEASEAPEMAANDHHPYQGRANHALVQRSRVMRMNIAMVV